MNDKHRNPAHCALTPPPSASSLAPRLSTTPDSRIEGESKPKHAMRYVDQCGNLLEEPPDAMPSRQENDRGADTPRQRTILEPARCARKGNANPSDNGCDITETVWTASELAERMGVSSRTILRWGRAGLVGRKLRFPDGAVRLVFTERSVRRFAQQHGAIIRRGAAFTRLSPAEKLSIVKRARELASRGHVKPYVVARQISAETGRAVETIRYTLRRYDELHPDEAVFVANGTSKLGSLDSAILERIEAGESAEEVARALDCDVDRVRRTCRESEVRALIDTKPRCIHNPMFSDPDADALILEIPEPPGETVARNRRPSGELTWCLGAAFEPHLLTREQEADLFRRYNYLKFKALRLLDNLEPTSALDHEIGEVQQLLSLAFEIRNRLVRHNLRLVVSIAKRFSRDASALSDLLSEGNITLMRTVEAFDFARGNKFSTFATTALTRSLLHAIAVSRKRNGRFVAASHDQLEQIPDSQTSTEVSLESADVVRVLWQALSQLDERARTVIIRRFGLSNGGSKETLADIGRDFGVTKECIRQVQKAALDRLRQFLAGTDIVGILDAA